MSSQIAAQLFTLRDYLKTPADVATTLKKVRHIGFEAVQASGLGPIEPTELKKLLDDNGLTCCATHRSFDFFRDQPEKAIEEHQILNCSLSAIGGYFPSADQFTSKTWGDFIEQYNKIGAKLKAKGLYIGYHNHSHEFARVSPNQGEKTAWHMLTTGLSHDVWIEVDTYWVAHGGGDAALEIERAAGRIPAVHFKDIGIKPDRTHYMMEVGEGNLNWSRIIQACKTAGVKWYIIEQDTCYRDPFESLKISFDNLKHMGIV
jgi:sugar phosphate isomerase/epimerase